MSARLIESHYEHAYGNAIARLNGIRREIDALEPGEKRRDVIRRLKQDEAEWLSSRLLHELYFASLGGDGRAISAPMEDVLVYHFGSFREWREQFETMAHALSDRPGWVLLTYVPREGRLINQLSTDHAHQIAGAIPILALDMYEHAYQLEFGANAEAYVAAFLRNIDWSAVWPRYEDASRVPSPCSLEQRQFGDVPSIAPEDVRSMLDAGAPMHLIDVRPRHYATRSHEIVDGAVWRDPERVGEWIHDVPKDVPVVAFCVYGFHIGCETTVALRQAGIDARYMRGGHYGWKAMRGPVKLFHPV